MLAIPYYGWNESDVIIDIFAVENETTFVLPLPHFDTFKHVKPQYFDFPDTIIQYLLSTDNSKNYDKLIKTCKYFFFKKRVTVISQKAAGDYIFDEGTENSSPKLPINQISKIWITNEGLTFPMHSWENTDIANDTAASKLCRKIYKCDAKFFGFYYQNLTENEFHILVRPEFVQALTFIGTNILNTAKNSFLPLEDIVKRIPKAFFIRLFNVPYTSNTFSTLASLKREKKLEKFHCSPSNSNKFFDMEAFKKFVADNALPNASFDIGLKGCDERTTYQKEIDIFLNSWNPIKEKPEIDFN